jgi:hypothetical protein
MSPFYAGLFLGLSCVPFVLIVMIGVWVVLTKETR